MLLSCASILSRIPLGVHYWFADWILYPTMYYLVRYRRRVVAKNIAECFPEKRPSERKAMAKGFYHQFCYTIVESIYGYRCSDEEMRERVRLCSGSGSSCRSFRGGLPAGMVKLSSL